MKRIFIFIFLTCSVVAYSQTNKIKVSSSEIIIGNDAAVANFNINLNNKGSKPHAVTINNATTVTSGWNYGAFIGNTIGKDSDVGLRVNAYSSTSLTKARSYGVYSVAGNATSGYNYGIFSYIHGSNNGAAIFGMSSSGMSEVVSGGKFAGWFMGRVYMSEYLGIGKNSPSYPIDVNGNIRCTSLIQTSDLRTKTNVASLENSLMRVGQLRAVKYNFIDPDIERIAEAAKAIPDTAKSGIPDMRKYLGMGEKKDADRKHIGFIAQEFKDVFPELVYEDEKGMLSIDYVSLIPVLVETIQTLNKRVETLEAEKNRDAREAIGSSQNAANNFSFSFFPNPTNGFVTIDYSLFTDATICIELYNSFGQRVKSIVPNQNKSTGSYNLQTSVADLTTGVYIMKATSGNQTESKQLIVSR